MCDGMLVVFSSWQGTLNVFVLDSKPPPTQEDPLREPLTWDCCAMPPTPPQPKAVVNSSQKSYDTLQHVENSSPNVAKASAAAAAAAAQAPGGSQMWQKRDLQQIGAPELGTASLLSTVCTVSRALGETSSPQSCDTWSSLCTDPSRNRCCPVLYLFHNTCFK